MKNNGIIRKTLDFIERLPIYSIITLLIGICLLVFPEKVLEVALRICGALLLVYALYRLIAVFVLDADIFESSANLISTVIILTLGVLFLINPLFISGVISTLFGIYLIVIGLFNLWRSSVIKEHCEIFGIEENKDTKRSRAITAIISLVLGLILVIFPLAIEKFTAIITGICLIIESSKTVIFKIIELFRSNNCKDTKTIEADFIDKSDTL